MSQTSKRFIKNFVFAMIAYVIGTVAYAVLLNYVPSGIWRYVIIAIPLVPVVILLVIFIRFLKSLDELQQRIQFLAIGFSAAATGLTTFTLGFMETGVAIKFESIWVLPMLAGFWGVGLLIFSSRYR